MYSFCVREFEKPVILEFGNLSAKNRLSDPHPHLLPVSCLLSFHSVHARILTQDRTWSCRLSSLLS
jgi:hypothetical protein